MNIKYRPAAIQDIRDASEYIQKVLKNPSAAVTLKTRVLHGISLLRENPYMGIPLDSRFDGVETGIRYLVVSMQLIFYELNEDVIEIVRVLDGRTDYLSKLFD